MRKKILFPAIDLKDGKCVRLTQGDYDQKKVYNENPLEVAKEFADAALTSDPIKAVWRSLYQFNNIDPARVRCPTLLVAGDQDPYAPLHVQQELFSNLGRGFDRTWSILAESDHAAHLLEGRHRLISLVSSFVRNGKRAELVDRY